MSTIRRWCVTVLTGADGLLRLAFYAPVLLTRSGWSEFEITLLEGTGWRIPMNTHHITVEVEIVLDKTKETGRRTIQNYACSFSRLERFPFGSSKHGNVCRDCKTGTELDLKCKLDVEKR